MSRSNLETALGTVRGARAGELSRVPLRVCEISWDGFQPIDLPGIPERKWRWAPNAASARGNSHEFRYSVGDSRS
jgi:hypothetical protein